MGGATPQIYVRPIPDYPADKWRSTYGSHTRRNPPSREPGVDYYCPIGTVLVSLGDGYVSEIGGGIGPASGRYVRVNLDNGQGFRLLHLGPRGARVPGRGRVSIGQPLAISGASGYGSEYFGASSPYDAQMILNTGGPHTHLSLFPRWGAAYAETIDPEPWMMNPVPKEWDEMATRDEVKDAVREVFNERTMNAASIVPIVGDAIYLVSGITGRRAQIASPYHVDLIRRVLKDNSNDEMYAAELDIVSAYFTAINPPPLAEVDTDALAAKLAELDDDADPAVIEAAVKAALAATVTEIRLTLPES